MMGMTQRCILPVAETMKIGRVIYRVSAHYGETCEALKPKIEKLLRREIKAEVCKHEYKKAV